METRGNMKNIILVLVLLFNPFFSYAIDEYETVIIEQNFNSSSKVVIDKKEIERSRAKDIPSLLATQANISVSQSKFQPNSIFLRGGDSGHILILVDGVPYYDASTSQRTINLSSLNLKSVQRIEVIKGSQSVLYGGQALAGVIKIDTIPQELNTSGQVLIEGGMQNHRLGSAGGVLNLADQVALIIRGSYSERQNLSPILHSTQKYPSSLSIGELAYVDRSRPIEAILKLQTSFDQTRTNNFSNSTYQVEDADDFRTSAYQLNFTSLFFAKNLFLQPKLFVSKQNSARLFLENLSLTKREYSGDLLSTRLEVTLLQEKSINVIAGIGYTKEQMDTKDLSTVLPPDSPLKSVNEWLENENVFARVLWTALPWIDLEIGARSEFRKLKDRVDTGHFGLILNQQFKLEASSGYRSPNLFQLYGDYGSSDLKPEKAFTYSATYENNYYGNQVSTSGTVFHTKFSDLLTISPAQMKYINLSNTETKGIEFMVAYRPLDVGLNIQLTMGYQEPRDLDNANWLQRRPLKTASLKLRQEIGLVGLGFEAIHSGERRDRSGMTTYINLPDYTLLNATVDYKPSEQWTIYARGQNLGNYRYESAYSYHDEGINAFAGVEYSF